MRILVVDDDRDYLGHLAGKLQARGHDVLSAFDGKEARELLDIEHADLIVSDVVMPNLDGIWFHSYVREFSDMPDIPFIFMTSRDEDVPSDLVVNPSVDLSVSKKLGLEKIADRIERFGNAASAKANPARN